MKITKDLLIKLGACKDGLDWWIRNGLDGFPSERLIDIEGDYRGYISWLKGIFYRCTFDDKGNKLTFNDHKGYSWESTYDEFGNRLTYKDSSGYSWEKTYDQNGNQLSYMDSNGVHWEATYDDLGNRLTYEHSSGRTILTSYNRTKDSLIVQEDDQIVGIPLDW